MINVVTCSMFQFLGMDAEIYVCLSTLSSCLESWEKSVIILFWITCDKMEGNDENTGEL